MDKWSHEYPKFIKFHFISIYIVAIYFLPKKFSTKATNVE